MPNPQLKSPTKLSGQVNDLDALIESLNKAVESAESKFAILKEKTSPVACGSVGGKDEEESPSTEAEEMLLSVRRKLESSLNRLEKFVDEHVI